MVSAAETPSARRFALVCPNFHPRTCGVGDHTMRIASELGRRGHAVAIFTRAPASPNPEAPGISVVGASGATPLLIAEHLRREVEAFAPTDLILQYTPQMLGAWRFGSVASLWLAAAARRRGVNVVLLAHELFLPWSKRPDLAVGAAAMRLQLAALMRIVNRVLVTMQTRTEEVSGLARLVHLSRPVGVVRVGSGALPIPRAAHPGRLRLGMFSTLASTKRFDVLLDTFRLVQARHPEAELVVLGDLGDPSSPRVRAFHDAVAAHPAASRIRLCGKQPLAEIAREVSELDVYLFPMVSGANTRSSTLPLALGAGVPVVAIRSYETDPIFVDEENLLFAEALTGEAFAAAVLRIAGDSALAARLAEGGRILYREQLSWEKIGDQLLSLI
jgi:glycosyltransferase involved in cell wall biosynthesis